MLTLRLELLMGRYVACTFNDRNRHEWPPHPARVFSALVTAYHDGDASPAQRRALQWLEAQPAPALSFSPAAARDLKTVYVPVNDKALSDTATVRSAWAGVLAPDLPPARRAKAEARLQTAYTKAGAPEDRLPKSFRETVAHVLPHSRTKQPRTFPSVTPHEPVVWLRFEHDPEPEIRAGLDDLLRQLVRLGHSSSLVAACVVEGEGPSPSWVPDPEGSHPLRWVGPGQLAALEALHAAAPYSEQRVMPYVVARYRPAGTRTTVVDSTFAAELIVLRRVDGPRLPLLAAEPLADAVRRALMHHADDPPAPLISGHDPAGGPLQHDHLAVVPLPFVDAPHATGDLLGVALVPPSSLGRDALLPLYTAIARWEAAHGERGDGPRSVLTLGRLGRWVLERSLDPSPLLNLRESTWTGPATQWASVTPMVLDRHPGALGDARPAKRRRAVRRAHQAIEAACVRIGLPPPQCIELDTAPYLRGSEPADRFARRRLDAADRRPRLHVRLSFAQPVRGPVLLGAGRYRGLGLLRPLPQDAP